MSKPPNKHHYIPKRFQTRFTDNAGKFWVYDTELDKYRNGTPNDTGFENGLYTFEDDNGQSDTTIENPLLSEIDGYLTTPLAKLTAREELSESERSALATYIAFQITRVPTSHKVLEGAERRIIETLLDRFKTMATALKKPFKEDEWRRALEGNVANGKRSNLEIMMDTAKESSPKYSEMKWTIYHTKEEPGFITCDNPAVLTPAQGVPEMFRGGMQTSDIMMALSPTVTLWMSEGEKKELHEDLNGDNTYKINANTVINSGRFVICKDKAYLEDLIKRVDQEEEK